MTFSDGTTTPWIIAELIINPGTDVRKAAIIFGVGHKATSLTTANSGGKRAQKVITNKGEGKWSFILGFMAEIPTKDFSSLRPPQLIKRKAYC